MSVNDTSSIDISEIEEMIAEPQAPLTETTFYILLSLAPEAKHGYAIAKDVQALSAGRVTLSTSTLYTALKRLLDDDWIERVSIDAELDESGRPRKTYTLTQLGRRILQLEVARLESLVAVSKLRVAGEQI
jgi:DNA-binding PadR family transcriptional regulator